MWVGVEIYAELKDTLLPVIYITHIYMYNTYITARLVYCPLHKFAEFVGKKYEDISN
jgi:hypothetical protein